MMSKHTPLPWKWGWNGDNCVVWGIAIVLGSKGDDKEEDKKTLETNAEFIVRACNSHDELLAACKYVKLQLNVEGVLRGLCAADAAMLEYIDKVITKAEGVE